MKDFLHKRDWTRVQSCDDRESALCPALCHHGHVCSKEGGREAPEQARDCLAGLRPSAFWAE